MSKEKRKWALGGAGLFCLLLLAALLDRGPDGATQESREVRLSQLHNTGGSVSIGSELTLDGDLISGYVGANGRYGLAVFKPQENGGYRFQSNATRTPEELLHMTVSTDEGQYDLFWANRADLEYAELAYAIPGTGGETLRLDAGENQIVFAKAPAKAYSVEYAFVDSAGNRSV